MRLELSQSAATAALTVALTMRTFYGLALDAPEVLNAAWLAAPLGAVLALPVVWLMVRGSSSRILSLLIFAGILLDTATTLEWTAFSESCLAFDHASPVLLMLPLILAVTRCAWLGGDAVGGAARLWIRVFALLVILMALCQLPRCRISWLSPWLGAGAGSLLRAGLRATGWNVLLCGAVLGVCKEPLSFRAVLPSVLIACGVAAVLLAFQRMMAPVAMGETVTRQMRIDALLTNGRAPLALQLPLIVAWFSGMLHLMAVEAIATCGLVHGIMPKAGEGICIALGLGAVFTLSLMRVTNLVVVKSMGRYLYPVIGAVALLKEVRRRCAASA